MKKNGFLFLFLCCFAGCMAQEPANRPHCANADFDKKVSQMLSFNVALIGVEELKNNQTKFLILDAREHAEYEVSHLEGAQYLGYKSPNWAVLDTVRKDTPIVIYCSVGYRSEKLGRRLERLGFTNVRNLYGSIFDWVNRGNLLVDASGQPTDKIHTYNRKWSQWVEDGKAEKVW